MKNVKGFAEGTVGIICLHTNDDRRSKFKCCHLKCKNGCAYFSKCIGSSQCAYYEERSSVIQVVPPVKKKAVFVAKHPVSAAKEILSLGQRIKHIKYGYGVVAGQSKNGKQVTIDFGVFGVREMDVMTCYKKKLIKVIDDMRVGA